MNTGTQKNTRRRACILIGVATALGLTGACSDQQPVSSGSGNDVPAAPIDAVVQITLPAEDLAFRESALPGHELATRKCTICHSVDYIHYQPPNKNIQDWTAEVQKMHNAYGAALEDAEIAAIGAYLAVAYGSASASDADVVAASAMPAAMMQSASATGEDIQGLLQSNACLGCHAIDKQLVGPAFSEVAKRYQDDPSAVDTVAASIKAGGAGKWGSVPMPPMVALDDAQRRTLARFVLAQ